MRHAPIALVYNASDNAAYIWGLYGTYHIGFGTLWWRMSLLCVNKPTNGLDTVGA